MAGTHFEISSVLETNLVPQSRLESEGFEDENSLEETIKKLDMSVKKARKKEVDGDDVTVQLILSAVESSALSLASCSRKNRHFR